MAKTEKAHLAWMRVADREGHAAVLTGHGLPLDVVRRLAEPVVGHGPHDVREVFMTYTRCKWCERIDGFGCDLNGEWHGHWSESQQNPHHPDAGAVSVVFPPVTEASGD